MAWDDDLLPEQRVAAGHSGIHARLLAGPGTGKTLTMTRHILFLVEQQRIDPKKIVAVTFTRAAAGELRQRVEDALGTDRVPRISTLHSFALRQLLRNSNRITTLPQPLRIADDWEERNIILEDLKSLLRLQRVKDARDLINNLSADWQSLTADETDWETRFPNPEFLAAWREHRTIYGYSLRDELVYQLKRVMEQYGDFELEGNIRYLLVDEYQDLNRCDIAVVHQIASRNAELFVAGDDDQSIYGFRKAHPEGIRRFSDDYVGSRQLILEICKRCDKNILDLGLFVARQDIRRSPKIITPEIGRGPGEVSLLRFPNQDSEAGSIARICRHLIDNHGLQPSNILILLRSDHKGVFTTPIQEQLVSANVPVAADTDGTGPLYRRGGRTLLAFLRLAINSSDHLSWRTLLTEFCVGIGPGAIQALYELARRRGDGFSQIILAASNDQSIITSQNRNCVARGILQIQTMLQSLLPSGTGDYGSRDLLMNAVGRAAEQVIADSNERGLVMNQLALAAKAIDATSAENLIRGMEIAGEDIEQELEPGKINILTMHRAKGLTAEAVIIVAAEDEYLPGRAQGDAVDDERRLLYVSLTRAKHYLFITYCDRRTGRQQHTGRNNGRYTRSLTQFLRDGPITPNDGQVFVQRLR